MTKHNRFKDAPWYPIEDTYVQIGGAGGIGSWTAMLLARSGFKPVVYDFDILEEHNLGGQLFPKRLIGKPKVEALQQVIKDFCDEEIWIENAKIDESSPTNALSISAFDNMKARFDLFHNWVAQYLNDPRAIFIDGRLNAEQMQIFCVRGGDDKAINDYRRNHLFDDSEVEDAPCTMKQTSHAAAMIAAHIVGFFTNHITNVYEEENMRDIPFKWEYFIPLSLVDVQQEGNDI